MKDKGIRLVVAEVLDDTKAESHYNLRQLFGEDAFYTALDDVVNAYRQKDG